MRVPALLCEHVSKAYGQTTALADVSIEARRGEIVGLVGENGAGKSTLMKIVSGIIPHGSFSGRVVVDGEERRFHSIRDAERAGLVAIPQELALVPALTVTDNLYLGRERRRWGTLDYATMRRQAVDDLAQFEIELDPDTPVGELSVAQQQVIEIVRALSRQARILLLDEPTASLTHGETELLFERLERLRVEGLCSVYVSHRLDEIQQLADRVVVLRDGRVALEGAITELNGNEIVHAMVGRELLGASDAARPPRETPALEVRNLRVPDPRKAARWRVEDITFTVNHGEILALFGAVGSGRTEVLHTLYGAYGGLPSGTMILNGERTAIGSPADALQNGIALLTEDRKGNGLEPALSVRANLTLAALKRFARSGVIDQARESRVSWKQVRDLRIAIADVEQPVVTLSGGNQQKALIGRALLTEPLVLLLDEPTRGVDIGAKADIFELLRGLAAAGLAIVMVSSEAPEVLEIAHRVLVLRKGRIVAERRTAQTSAKQLVADATGITGEYTSEAERSGD